MAFKQPRVPEYRESEGTGKYLRSLVLFLKDFCNDVWTANNQRAGEIGTVKAGYPVTSVCGKTGDVALDAGDVGALATGGTATDSGKLGGVVASDYALKTDTAPDSSKLEGKTLATIKKEIYPVGAIYMSVSSTSPASLFGGTWEQLKDRFLLGAGGSYAAGGTGGAATVSLSVNQMPAHYHEETACTTPTGRAEETTARRTSTPCSSRCRPRRTLKERKEPEP